MKRALPLMICLTVGLAGCGKIGSVTGSLGSVGSLGGGGPKMAGAQPREALPSLVPAELRIVETDARIMAATITAVELTKTPSGAILRATGTPPANGAYNAALVPAGLDGNTLVYDFRMMAQPGATREPGQITVATPLTRDELAGVRTITVRSAGGRRSVRR